MRQPRVPASGDRWWPTWLTWPRRRRQRGLVQELQGSQRATIWTLLTMLVLSLVSSGYLLLVSQPRVTTLTELTQQSRIAYVAMLDQETGLRGWLATGDMDFLEPYSQGQRDWAAASESLLNLPASSEFHGYVLDMLLAHQAWEEWAEQATGAPATEADRTSGRLGERLARGKDLFDDYRDAQVDSTDVLAAERDEAFAQQQAALVTVLLSTLALLTTATFVAVRRGRRLRRTVVGPLQRLLGTISALRAGDLSRRSEPTGVAELDSMGAALGELAADLQQAGEDASAREARLALLAARFETVVRVARETSASLSARYVSETVAAAAAELLGTTTTLWVRSDEGLFLATRRSGDPHGTVPASTRTAPAMVVNAAADARPGHDGDSRAYPMVLAGMVVGVLEATAPQDDDDIAHVLEALLSTAAAALEAARLHSSVRKLADIDALTQLPNRRRLEADLDTEWARAHRYSRPLSFVMLDLDSFKQLNDRYGHLVGDTMLHAAAAALTAELRSSDTAYRYGGEEMAVLLRETGPDEAARVAERLRAAIAEVRLPETDARVTASVGVSSAADPMISYPELVGSADAALYLAKSGGRNRVAVAPTVGGLPLSR